MKGLTFKGKMMMTTAKKKTNKKGGKHHVKPDTLMSEDMEQSLLAEHSHKHGKPADVNEFYHKKVSPHPSKK